MSREQLTEQQVEVGGAEREGATPDQTHGLPPHVYAQVRGLGPADASALADLLILYPALSNRILTVAAPHVGNASVQRAITIAQSKTKVQGTPSSVDQAGMHEIMDDKPAAAESQGSSWQVDQAGMHEIMDDKPAAAKSQGSSWQVDQAGMHEIMDDKPAAAKPQGASWQVDQAGMHEIMDDKPAAEPAWVGGARKYNAAHAELVADFNELTGNSCLDPSGQLDPQAVARWQRQHGVEADGKVGPHTVAAARAAQAKAGPAGAASEQRIDL